jgi:hypothetical protein
MAGWQLLLKDILFLHVAFLLTLFVYIDNAKAAGD